MRMPVSVTPASCGIVTWSISAVLLMFARLACTQGKHAHVRGFRRACAYRMSMGMHSYMYTHNKHMCMDMRVKLRRLQRGWRGTHQPLDANLLPGLEDGCRLRDYIVDATVGGPPASLICRRACFGKGRQLDACREAKRSRRWSVEHSMAVGPRHEGGQRER